MPTIAPLKETRGLTYQEKLKQVDEMYQFASEMSWIKHPADESEAVNSIWNKLKSLYGRR